MWIACVREGAQTEKHWPSRLAGGHGCSKGAPAEHVPMEAAPITARHRQASAERPLRPTAVSPIPGAHPISITNPVGGRGLVVPWSA